MAIKCLIALCLVLGASLIRAEADADADADAYYGPYGYYGHHRGYYGLRHHYGGYRPYGYGYKRYGYNHGYWKRPYHYYKPRPVVKPIPAPAPVEPLPAPVEPVPAPIAEVKVAPAPAPAPEPVPEPAPVPVVKMNHDHYYAEHVLRPFNVVPAVPKEHSVAYSALPMMSAPPPAPAPEVYEAEALQEVPQVAPVAVAAPAGLNEVVSSQYHAQDEFGNVIYGYSHPNSAKTEQRDVYGNVMGSYSYVDGTGLPKHVAYVADDFGFRVTSANNLPIAAAV